MSVGRTWILFGAMLLYAVGVSAYVAASSLQTMGSQDSADAGLMLGGITFLYVLGAAVWFMLLVCVLDLVTRRQQQAMMALAIGLAASATYQAVVQVAFVQSYTYYKTTPAAHAGQPPSTPTPKSR
jgi:hypothetical protein